MKKPKEGIVFWLLGGTSMVLAAWQYVGIVTGYTD